MLVLSRSALVGKNAIVCETKSGEQIRVIVSEVKGDKVRLAIDAPRSVRVRRGELTLVETAKEHSHAFGAQ